MITADQTLDSVIRLGSSYSQVLNEFGFDTCCGGYQTLQQNAQELSIDLTKALTALNAISVK